MSKRLAWTAAAAMALMAPPQIAWAQDAPEAVAPDAEEGVAGHYYLTGMMETGSELLLQPDGVFKWYLIVGALDLLAEGHWTAKGDVVTLIVEQQQTNNPEMPVPFEQLVLTRDAEDGALVPGEPLRGRYVKARAD